MKVTFTVTGLEPIDRNISAFMRAAGLGIDGVYIRFHHIFTCTQREGYSSDLIPPALKEAYDQLGCIDIKIWEEK